MVFREVEDHPGLYEYRGQKVQFELYIESDGRVTKLVIHYPDELFASPQDPEFLRTEWPSKEDALRAGMERAKTVIDRKL